MLTLQEFQAICRVLGTYCANEITPLQVMQQLRQRHKESAVAILSLAFEEVPGYMTYTITEFIDIIRRKVLIQ
jgi:hypothetical protein